MSATDRQKGSAFKPHFPAEVERGRLTMSQSKMYGSLDNEPFGMFLINPEIAGSRQLRIMVGDGLGWDHVSVSTEDRCPIWEEMKYVKDFFFRENATVIQFHPSKEHYVNNHEYVLHLWHKQGVEHELPPRELV